MTAIAQNVTMYAGDHKNLVVTVTNAAGAAVNLTGATIRWVLAKSAGSAVVVDKSTGGHGITITPGTGGVFTVALVPADTEGLLGVYYHEASVVDTLSNVITVLTGAMAIEPSAIREP